MSESNKTYRIRTNIGSDTSLNVNLNQDFDVLELLSLKINREDIYKLQTANYGCIAGRVLGNSTFGVPNAKISVFIPNDDDVLNAVIQSLYPYARVSSLDSDGKRYNLLPEEQVSQCHVAVGSFPSKRMVLDDNTTIEIFDKYYKYTTRSNEAGDYMIFGVPVGEHILHVDIDLSDIGVLSQKPIDLVYKGYDINQFDSPSRFKTDTNLDSLAQIITENYPVVIQPFWGDNSAENVAITRQDIPVRYKFEPTCVFLGSIITDSKSNGVSKKCIASDRMGKMNELTSGSGTIEMIRKKPDGTVEEFAVKGTQVIDGDGTWCYQIPMNLDYMSTDEYGNLVPSNDPTKGIPTRTRVRFRISLTDYESDYSDNHLAKVLVPNHPDKFEDLDYVFGSNTKDDEFATKSFRDLFWNNIYTVKSYIPRIQNGDKPNKNKHFTGFKQINVYEGNNPLPYNNIRIDINFTFILLCALIKAMILLVTVINEMVHLLDSSSSDKNCVTLGGGLCPDLEDYWVAPGCHNSELKQTLEALAKDGGAKLNEGKDNKSVDDRNGSADRMCLTNKLYYFKQCIEINLAMEYNVIQFDFYNDWINGLIYIPRWFMKLKKKRSYLFGLIKRKAKLEACMEETYDKRRNLVQQCALTYSQDANKQFTRVTTSNGCASQKSLACHKAKGTRSAHILTGNHTGGGGLVHNERTLKEQSVYYFKPAEWLDNGKIKEAKCNLFATDIVLLGSLKDCDAHGMPQAFKFLSPTTYKMPQNLAATNMQTDSYMYSINGKGGTVCNLVSDKNFKDNAFDEDGIQQGELTFKYYHEWAKQGQLANDTSVDSTDYAITEASGIDWGYIGPNQGTDDKNHLYHPGGHFLGIGCTHAETDIKSCVNLSRVCEAGATISQRKMVLTPSTGSTDYSLDYFAPTGLINNIDMEDSDFRQMFATLNFNNLETMYDKETGSLRYKLIPLNPFGFGGELLNQTANTSYTDKTGVYDNTNIKSGSSSKLYRYTNETPSPDYYKFRMGLKDDTDIYSKYLTVYTNSNTVAIPVYENSFYFYFGIRDGKTAYDKFLSDFYQPCPVSENKYAYAEIKTSDQEIVKTSATGETVVTCGIVDVAIHNMMPPFICTFENASGDTIGTALTITGTTFSTGETSTGLFKTCSFKSGKYYLRVSDFEGTEIVNSFEIKSVLSNIIKNLKVRVTDSRDITVPNGKIVVEDTNDVKYLDSATLAPVGGAATSGGTSGTTYVEFTGLSGNTSYNVTVKLKNFSVSGNIYLGTFDVGVAPGSQLDFYIGDKSLTGTRLKEFFLSGSTVVDDWYNKIKNDTLKSELQSVLTGSTITIGFIGGTPPYSVEALGCGEKTISSGTYFSSFNTQEHNETYGWDTQLSSIKLKTSYITYDLLGNPTIGANSKYQYYVHISDADGKGKLYYDTKGSYDYTEAPTRKLPISLSLGVISEGDVYILVCILSQSDQNTFLRFINLEFKYDVVRKDDKKYDCTKPPTNLINREFTLDPKPTGYTAHSFMEISEDVIPLFTVGKQEILNAYPDEEISLEEKVSKYFCNYYLRIADCVIHCLGQISYGTLPILTVGFCHHIKDSNGSELGKALYPDRLEGETDTDFENRRFHTYFGTRKDEVLSDYNSTAVLGFEDESTITLQQYCKNKLYIPIPKL